MKKSRDIAKTHSTADSIAKLRRLADSMESGRRFGIKIAGENIYVSARATYSVEHQRNADGEEIAFQLRWNSQRQ